MDEFVCAQLTKANLAHCVETFKDNEIDQDVFCKLTDEDLRLLLPGKIGAQVRIRELIKNLQDADAELEELAESVGYLTADQFLSSSNSTHWEPALSMRNDDEYTHTLDGTGGSVLIYIDNSNIFINTQQHAAKIQKFRHGLRFDKRCRVDAGKLFNRARGSYEVLEANLYGSEPPLLDTVWKAIREKHMNVKTHKRSSWTNKEKEIDTALVADAVEKIMKYRDVPGKRSVILFTGDKDMLTVIRKAQQYGWRVVIWSYKDSLSNEIEKHAKRNPAMLKIELMDAFFKDCTFTVTNWGKPNIPYERTMVLLLDVHVAENEQKRKVTEIVNICTAILRMPMMAQFLGSDYQVAESGTEGIATTNRFDQFGSSNDNPRKSYTPLALICYQGCHKYLRQQSSNEQNFVKPTEEIPPGYDFNKDVWSKKDEIKRAIPSCFDIIPYQQYRQSQSLDMVPDHDHDLAGESENDDPDIDYVVIEKKQKKKWQKFSDFCEYRFRCSHGLKCTHGHGPNEKEFFKAHPNALRRKYKTQLCMYSLKGSCKYMEKSYLCLYAHNLHEYICCNCGEVGMHYSDECPEATK